MYKACMFCKKPLATNEVLETFPVGRRLAFDAHKGRLWVVCQRCERWNLTPMRERWEAVEACEKIFRGTKVRVSSENIGLARHPEGLELVRVGKPLRPEFAAWRYGDQFGRRRKRNIIYGVAAAAVVGGITIGGAATGVIGGALVSQPYTLYKAWQDGRTLVKLRTSDGKVTKLKRPDLLGTRVRLEENGPSFKLEVRKGKKKSWHDGEEARRFAAAILPKMNAMGGKADTVQSAVSEIEHAGHPSRFIEEVAQGEKFHDKKGVPGYINKMPKPTKLALEMALHEEQERRALEGELWLLEQAWKEAEEIADISDNLLLPKEVDDFIDKHKGGSADESGGAPVAQDKAR